MEDKEVSKMDNIKEQRNLVRKIYSDKSISREVIQNAMGKIWKHSKATSLKEVEKTLFIINFSMETEKQIVVFEKIWLFGNKIFALQPLNERKQLNKI